MTAKYDVLAIGNALVDLIVSVDDAFLSNNGLDKGMMTLIDEARAKELYAAVKDKDVVQMSGGSAGNTIAALASLGGDGAYIGRVAGDELGTAFRGDLKNIDVHFATKPADDGSPTGYCLSLVTPDAQRTMQTFLGAANELAPEDVNEKEVAAASIVYLEGYLWDPAQAKRAFIKAAEVAHSADRMVALSLSDPFCVDRHRPTFVDLIRNHVDIVFANEDEIKSLYEVETFDEAMQRVKQDCNIAALTRSEKGSIIVAGDEVHVVDAVKPKALVDTTGAGDAYAAGFLYGLTQEYGLASCGRIASIAAAEVISHYGARPLENLSELLSAA